METQINAGVPLVECKANSSQDGGRKDFLPSLSELSIKYKIIVSACFALAFGSLFFLGLFYSENVALVISLPVSAILVVMLAMLLIFSPTSACVLCLMFPSMTTRPGKAILYSFITTLLIAGPIANITHNMDSTADSLICFGEQSVNQSRDFSRFVFETAQENLANLKQSFSTLNSFGKTIEGAVSEIENAFESAASGIQSAAGEITEAMEQCRQNFDATNCQRSLDEIQNKCKDSIAGRKKRSPGFGDFVANIGKEIEEGAKSVASQIKTGAKDIGKDIA